MFANSACLLLCYLLASPSEIATVQPPISKNTSHAREQSFNISDIGYWV
jgi:hypothetical protein